MFAGKSSEDLQDPDEQRIARAVQKTNKGTWDPSHVPAPRNPDYKPWGQVIVID